jgi:sigma-E factor negative regulatory protein RseB
VTKGQLLERFQFTELDTVTLRSAMLQPSTDCKTVNLESDKDFGSSKVAKSGIRTGCLLASN